MTVEIDLERAAEVAGRLLRHATTIRDVAEHLADVRRRTQLTFDGLTGTLVADRLALQLGLAAGLLARLADEAARADAAVAAPTSFAGGTVLCSAIQVASPIPARPSTSGVTGAIDGAAVARNALGLADTAATGTSMLAGRSVPIAALPAAVADLALCRLGVGSGAPISTRKIVDEHGNEIYEGSRSQHKHQTSNGEVLDPDLTVRDRQMWRVEHSNENGYLMQPYPGYPAYEVNAPRR